MRENKAAVLREHHTADEIRHKIMKNEDATQITFHLREGLKYSDGSPLTAENFRYAVERTCDPNTAGEYQSILFEIVGCADFAGPPSPE